MSRLQLSLVIFVAGSVSVFWPVQRFLLLLSVINGFYFNHHHFNHFTQPGQAVLFLTLYSVVGYPNHLGHVSAANFFTSLLTRNDNRNGFLNSTTSLKSDGNTTASGGLSNDTGTIFKQQGGVISGIQTALGLAPPPPTSPLPLNSNSIIARAFVESRVVSELIPWAPQSLLHVTFGNTEIMMGTELKPTQAVNRPDKVDWNAHPLKWYTLMMVDMDYPSAARPAFRSYLHWMVSNIQSNRVRTGTTMKRYYSVNPSRCTATHRYVILAYEQRYRIPISLYFSRRGFNVSEFAERHEMGLPVAGNFFTSQYDFTQPSIIWPCIS